MWGVMNVHIWLYFVFPGLSVVLSLWKPVNVAKRLSKVKFSEAPNWEYALESLGALTDLPKVFCVFMFQ